MPLSELIVTFLGGNIAKIIGNRNINIQDVESSNITINDVTTLENMLVEVTGMFQQSLYFIVFDKHDTRPFGKMTVLELIQSCIDNVTNANIAVLFMDPSRPIDEDKGDELKGIKSKSILLFNEEHEYCPLFQEVFNNYEIGGCVAIPSKKQTEDNIPPKKRLQTLVNIRENKHNRMNRRKMTYQYALKNISDDIDVIEAINNIIAAYMPGYRYDEALITPKNLKDKISSPRKMQLL